MADAGDLLKRAINCSEESNESLMRLQDEILPTYFFMAFVLGGEYKTIENLEKQLKNDQTVGIIKELYEKGRSHAKNHIAGVVCTKCKKELGNHEGMQFCLFCGEKLSLSITPISTILKKSGNL
jgi:hypothetical protein